MANFLLGLGFLLPLPLLLRLQPLEESFACGDDRVSLRVALKELRVIVDIPPSPLDLDFRLRPLHLVLRKLRVLAPRQERLGDLAPVAIHHVRFVELNLEKKR